MIEDKNPQRTSIENLGEFGLIDHITQNVELNQDSTLKGIGDDAAVINHTASTVVTTDMLVEGIHFDLSYVPLKHLGYKAVMVNLSDLYAMNAVPTQITVSIAMSNRFPVEAVEELYNGIKLACKIYNVDLIGGDTTASQSGLIISITAIGEQKEDDIIYRSGAGDNDLLVVSGDIGAAYMGLQILEREKAVYKANPNNQPDVEAYSYLLERQLKPEARKDIPKLLKELDVKPTSMIDLSDGLSSEVIHLCKNSNVGMKLYEEKLPLDPTVIAACEEFNLDSTTIALSGGEDYELLFTVKQEDFPKIKANPSLSIIGHAVPNGEGIHLITRSGEQIPIKAMGWNSFQE
ncbi:thiamine-phosphate kinase [Nonlabens ulvanivorans]|uniref:Thiamine-monophosphate kinase n=1 Tax=Nonlabens ulvanivorans TaxID=906888 RepID=A0A081D7I4_NONUL|nr:thiamine-phosphate kinase [Nonlabens ulvanivorans]KEZ92356.1 thiamine-monophosphate kinase [Nonlabens ulvanivorans]PRX15189.1 thiamine-phosphate kinase [Nonlabens ulvanivorans]GAK74880.1 thiamine-monophosphate kinase [Nonlabens ulvanivorans]